MKGRKLNKTATAAIDNDNNNNADNFIFTLSHALPNIFSSSTVLLLFHLCMYLFTLNFLTVSNIINILLMK